MLDSRLFSVFFFLPGALGFWQNGCTPAARVKQGLLPAPVHTLRFGAAGVPSNLDIAAGGGAYMTAALRPLHANLVTLNANGALKSELARTWSVASDHQHFSFCLESARFQDGSEIRPEDVQYSLARLADDEHAGYVSRLVQLIDPKVLPPETPDDRCVNVELRRPYANFIYLLTSPFAAIQKRTDDPQCQGSCLAFAGGFAGNYRLQSIDPIKKTLEYQRVRGSGRWNTIEMQTIPDAQTAIHRIIDGSLDAYMGLVDFQKVIEPPPEVCQTHWESMSYGNFKFNSGWQPIIQSDFRRDLARFIQAAVRDSLPNTIPLEYTTSLLSQGLEKHQAKPRVPAAELGAALIKTWQGHIPKGRFRVVSRLNMVNAKALETMTRDLQALGLQLEYVQGMTETAVNAIKNRDFEVAFGTWAASFNRPEEFLNMAHRLLVPEMERFPELRGRIKDLEETIFISDGPSRDREFIRLFNEIQDMAIINPVYKIHIPLLHSCRIKSQVAAWQFHPRLESLMLKGEL